MTTPRSVLALPIAALLILPAAAQEASEYQRRRGALMARMEKASVLVLRGTTAGSRRGEFRQNLDFYYLSGLERPGGILLLQPGAPEGQRERIYSAHRKEAAALGFAEVRPEGKFTSDFAALLREQVSAVYLERSGSRRGRPRRAAPPEQAAVEKARQAGREIALRTEARKLVGELRAIKSPDELARLRTAIDITCAAHRAVMRAARPGMNEGKLQKILEKVFRMNDSPRNGFSSIVGSGPNSCILHWSKNDRTTRPGDMVVLDIGAEYGGYSADVTRTIPINGKFSERQRAIYEIVLRANEECLAMVAPGVRYSEISRHASTVLFEGLKELGVIAEQRELRKYFYHGLGHNIGLAVHDAGPLSELKPGMVFTIEPGLYFREDGMGIRIEDDVLVTEDGHEVLSTAAPKSVAEIEALMAEKPLPDKQYLIEKTPMAADFCEERQVARRGVHWSDALLGLLPLGLYQLAVETGWLEGPGIVGYAVAAGLMAWLIAFPLWVWRHRGVERERLLNPPALLAELGIGVVGLLIMLGVGFLTALLVQGFSGEPIGLEPGIEEIIQSSQVSPALVVWMALACTVGPIAEEFFFRGLIYRGLRGPLGWIAAAAIQALLFAFFHPYAPAHLIQIFALGLALCAIYRWRRTLLAPILAHVLFNGLVTVALLVLTLAPKPFLGIQADPADPRCRIAVVLPGLAADRAGLLPGDVILSLDGEPVESFADLLELMSWPLYQPGQSIHLEVLRGEERLEFQAELGARPAPPAPDPP